MFACFLNKICCLVCAASPGSQPATTSSSSSADSLSKFYQTPSAAAGTAAGYMGSGTSSCGGAVDQRGLVSGFTGHSYPAVYPGDCLSPYSAYSYGGGGGGGGCLDSYLKVRPSPYPVSTDYPSYFTRVAGLHHHHHAAAAAAAASRSAGHVVGYDYGSA